ncbi:2-oxoacid:acceptor oxidoreductase family protein [Fusibacter paucivorans]|uniref:2-oxoacid:acceptor oxidoreductase family protein n=1 Tax=Fusibacter paucivorans TaxID=76009 RepID=A0ABS5PLY1_9FIRM|nr:2-oxoacid:acceptor oxidoreductase family protein [Fusibacter paucivorans]MBS7526179.1 2-oxoacid:acceptor oxidoreductase family protein [Fusibacter paucivorans]
MGEIRLHGRGGQGAVIAAEMLANAFVLGGRYASVFPSFGVERRGSAVMAFARYSDDPIREKTRVYHPDILMILDPTLLEKKEIYNGFKRGGTIIASAKSVDQILSMGVKPARIGLIDGMSIAFEETGTNITNVIMLGAFAKVTGLVEVDHLKTAVEGQFAGKLLNKNIGALARGYNETQLYEYEVAEEDDEGEHLYMQKKIACEAPPKTPFESAWKDCDKGFQTIQTGEWRFMRPTLNKKACRQCGWCSLYCPTGCIKASEDRYFVPNFDYCKGCGVCARECPAHAIKMVIEGEI